MTDCEDDYEAPAASIDALRATFESLGDAFREEAEGNVQDRADGEPTRDQDRRGHAERLDPFFPETILLAPHENGNEHRSLDRRSDGPGPDVPPMDSDSVDVQADLVQPGSDHTVECTVRNLGGKPARQVRVELYAEHYDLDARVDASADGVFELPKNGAGSHPIRGVTTVAPTSSVIAFAIMDDGDPHFHQVLDYTDRMSVGDDRTFSGSLGPRPTEFVNGEPVPEGRDDFRLELWETTVPDLQLDEEQVYAHGYPVYVAPEDRNARHLATLEGRYVEEPNNGERVDQFLTGSVDRDDRVGRQTTSIGAGDSSTLTFQYEPSEAGAPAPPDGLDEFDEVFDYLGPGFARTVTAFYVRAYSLAASELPDDWDALDHTKSRFVGRTELPREY